MLNFITRAKLHLVWYDASRASSWTHHVNYTSPEDYHSDTVFNMAGERSQRTKALEALANIARQANRILNRYDSGTSSEVENQLTTPNGDCRSRDLLVYTE